MILETKAGSESLKRPAKYGNCFPLKKRYIKYAVEDESENLETTEPENLSTKTQDLRIRPHFQVGPPKTAPPQEIFNFQQNRIPPLLPYGHLAQKLPSNYIPHHTLSTTQPKFFTQGWSHHNFQSLNFAHLRLQANQHQEFNFSHAPDAHARYLASEPLTSRARVTEVKDHYYFGGLLKPKHDREEPFSRIHLRDSSSVLNYKIYNFSFGIEQRESVSRSSCDSGVPSPFGTSAQSTTSSIDANSCAMFTPTVLNGTARYHCPTCNKEYSTVSGLTKHVQFHCGAGLKKSFVCKDCQKVYTSLGALKMHIRTHTLPCNCDTCGKAFSRPWLLEGHKRTHTGEKPYACNHCLRAFADRSNLRAHLQTHTKSKKYACPTCTKTFSRMSLLTKHVVSCPALPLKM